MSSSTSSESVMTSTTTTTTPVFLSYESRISKENILRILRKLYCRNICADFRKPVISSYPELAQTYRAVVREPMDLGTLIVKVGQGLDDLVEIKRMLKLIFANALTFNEGSYIMEAVSNHVSVFTKGLWEEAFLCPFMTDISSSQFSVQRLQARAERFIFVMHEPLLAIELKELIHTLASFGHDEFADLHERLTHLISTSLESGDPVSLHTVMTPLYNDLSSGLFDRTAINSLSASVPNTPAILYGASIKHVSSLSDIALKHLSHLDDALGEFLVCLCERKLRGADSSIIWARASTVLWAQPPKSAWSPCILLAGGDTSEAVAITNLSRIPETISKQLVRMKPKVTVNSKFGIALSVYCTKSLSSKILNPPDGYVLVEFFGAHDFGWLKLEHICPMTKDGAPPSSSSLIPDEAAVLEALDFMSAQKNWSSVVYDEDVSTDQQYLELSIVTPPLPPVPVKASSESRQKRKKETKDDKTSKHPAHSLFLSNKVVVPSFQTLPENATKKELALQKTKLLIAWANFAKPLSKRGRSPFIDSETVLISSATTARQAASVPPQKKARAESETSATKRAKLIESKTEEVTAVPAADGASTVSLTDAAYQKETPAVISQHFVGCIVEASGEGLVHTKLVDLNADIFFRESRKADIRKLILRSDLQRVHDALTQLQQVALSRLEDNKVGISGVVRRITVNPHRNGGVAVGNAKIGLAKYFLYQQNKTNNEKSGPTTPLYSAI